MKEGGEQLRTPFLIVAALLVALVFCLEIGSPFLRDLPILDGLFASTEGSLEPVLREQLADRDLDEAEREELLARALESRERPPGFGIPAMALLDGIIVFTLGLMCVSLVVPERIHARYQGAVTLVVAVIILVAAIVMIVLTTTVLFMMIALLLAFPFGTIAYLIKWGTFPSAQAAVTVGLIAVLRIGTGVCLVLAHRRFLQNTGLVLMILTAMLGGIIVSFLHGLVPPVLVSITDAVAAIVVCVLAAVWAVVLLVGAIGSVIKAIA